MPGQCGICLAAKPHRPLVYECHGRSYGHSNHQPKPLTKLSEVICTGLTIVIEVEDRCAETKGGAEVGKVDAVDRAVPVGVAEQAMQVDNQIAAGSAIQITIQKAAFALNLVSNQH